MKNFTLILSIVILFSSCIKQKESGFKNKRNYPTAKKETRIVKRYPSKNSFKNTYSVMTTEELQEYFLKHSK